MALGSGDSLGEALVDLARKLGGAPRMASYKAKGWHAQISHLTGTQRGINAAAAAGLTVSRRTLLDWLSERTEPNAANRAKIAEAYEIAAGRWPDWEGADFRIYGLVKTGDDVRNRGEDRTSPFLVESADASAATWADFRRQWEAGGMTADEVEDAFVDIVNEAVPDTSEGWEFPGSFYDVSV